MRIAVLVSGSGTNLQALIDASSRGELGPAQLCLVVSNRPGVRALERAADAGLANLVINHRNHDTRRAFEDALLEALEANGIEAVILAGFMRILSPFFVEKFENRILNTHPALCPSFPGINAPQQAITAGVKVSGCTVHFVDTGVDTGPIIFQEAVEVSPIDTAETLHARIQNLEHRLLPRATKLLAAGSLRVQEGIVSQHP
ncbi:MAG: phosphoribosylglycinamide formyltransferase [Myxococcales bacterium]|nr:phosphoribosylglycinamide formyltransferase [Myxococcales bacterium]